LLHGFRVTYQSHRRAGYSPRDLDPAVVAAAHRAQLSGQGDADNARAAAIAQLQRRLAELIRKKEKVEAMIANVQRELN